MVPEEPLAALEGEDPNGTWTLDVVDDAGGDSGTVNSWSLTIATLATAPVNDVATFDASSPGLFFDNVTPISDAVTGAPGFLCGVELVTDVTHTFAADIEMF